MLHGLTPRLLSAITWDFDFTEEPLKKLVCAWIRFAGIFRDSHCVAFLRKVMGGQGYVGATTPACPAKF